jgi:O-antigen ligase
VTVTAIPALAEGRPSDSAQPRDRRAVAEHVAVGVALVWWGFGLTHATGGRDRWSQTIAIVLALVAFVVVRPWRSLTTRSLVLGACVSVAPVIVCLLDPTHWFGASQAATYAYSAALFLTVKAYARDAQRRTLALAVVLGAGVAQMAWALIPWIGGGEPSVLLVGTFFWYNQLAAFLLAPAVIGAGLAAVGSGALRIAGLLAAVLGSAGVVLSTSRASMALLAVGWLLVGVMAVWRAEGLRRRGLTGLRWLAAAGVAGLLTVTLPGPPFFAHRVSALAATSVRGSGQSLSQNGGFRLQFWQQALHVFSHHPLTGAGFSSFGRQAALVDPRAGHSALVHSGLVQPLSDGGLLLGGPFLLVCLLVGLGLLRRLRPDTWHAEGGSVTLLALGSLLLAAHSAIDFDWTYPSLMALAAILSALALSWSPAPPSPGTQVAAGPVALVSCGLLLASALVLAQQAVPGGWRLTAPAPHASAPATSQTVSGEPAS